MYDFWDYYKVCKDDLIHCIIFVHTKSLLSQMIKSLFCGSVKVIQVLCSKILSHGLNHGLILLLFKLFGVGLLYYFRFLVILDVHAKGQLISEWNFRAFKSPKKPTKS